MDLLEDGGQDIQEFGESERRRLLNSQLSLRYPLLKVLEATLYSQQLPYPLAAIQQLQAASQQLLAVSRYSETQQRSTDDLEPLDVTCSFLRRKREHSPDFIRDSSDKRHCDVVKDETTSNNTEEITDIVDESNDSINNVDHNSNENQSLDNNKERDNENISETDNNNIAVDEHENDDNSVTHDITEEKSDLRENSLKDLSSESLTVSYPFSSYLSHVAMDGHRKSSFLPQLRHPPIGNVHFGPTAAAHPLLPRCQQTQIRPPGLPLQLGGLGHCVGISTGVSNCPELAQVICKLETRDLWNKFFRLGTEMIITKSGRRMFPTLRISFAGYLDPTKQYDVLLDFLLTDDKRYRYAYHKSRWLIAGRADAAPPHRIYTHPDSPFSARQLIGQVISFEKVKLTNNEKDKTGQIVLNSMHKFQPRVHLIVHSYDNKVESLSDLHKVGHKTFAFPETCFTAVTAYQNQLITKLKIDSNPFAKGFRDTLRMTDSERESVNSILAGCTGRNRIGMYPYLPQESTNTENQQNTSSIQSQEKEEEEGVPLQSTSTKRLDIWTRFWEINNQRNQKSDEED